MDISSRINNAKKRKLPTGSDLTFLRIYLATFDPVEAKKELFAKWEQLIGSGKISPLEMHKLHLHMQFWHEKDLLVKQELMIIMVELGLLAGLSPQMQILIKSKKDKTA